MLPLRFLFYEKKQCLCGFFLTFIHQCEEKKKAEKTFGTKNNTAEFFIRLCACGQKDTVRLEKVIKRGNKTRIHIQGNGLSSELSIQSEGTNQSPFLPPSIYPPTATTVGECHLTKLAI